jgi:hypothetical protein
VAVGNIPAAYYAGTYTLPKIDIYDDSDFANIVSTAQLSATTGDQTITASFTPSNNYKFLGLKFTTKTDATGTNADCEWKSAAIVYRVYGDTFNQYDLDITETVTDSIDTLRTPVANPYITVSNSATVAAYTEFTINHATQTVTITADTTMDKLYDYSQYDLTLTANLGYDEWYTTLDGINFVSTYDIVLNTGVDLTGGGSIEVGSGTFTRTGSATYDGIVIYTASREVHVKLNGLVSGSTVQIYNTTNSTEIYNAVVSATTLDYIYTYSADKDIRVRVRKKDYLSIEATGSITDQGFELDISQDADTIYNTIGIDGSTVTEASLSGSTVKIYVDDPNNSTTGQRIYAWYKYILATTTYIGIQDDKITARTETEFVFNSPLVIVNQDTSNALEIIGANILDETGSAINVLDVSNGASIAVAGDKVVYASSGSSGLTLGQFLALK